MAVAKKKPAASAARGVAPNKARASKSLSKAAAKSTPKSVSKSLPAAAKSAGAVPSPAKPGALAGRANVPALSKEQELAAYRQMLLIRRFEEKAGQMYGMGLIGGFCHLYIGQEAVVVGMQMAIEEGDQVITGYRDHGHMLACDMDPKGVMAELTGRRGGYSKGKGGSMHMFSVEKGFYGGHGIVGAQVSLGTGLALANRYRGNDRVSLAYFGDGAANQGQVYESFNMAELWKLPVIYIIENNRYAMGTSVTRSSAQTDFSKRGVSFNIPGEQVDGMDVRAVKAAGEKAVEWCRAGKGPYILEMLTYRYRGHSMSDPAKYRTREEVDKVRTGQDPIDQSRARILEKKFATEDDLKKVDATVRGIVNEAAEFATNDPEPDASELYTDVYRESV
jgi:pyruvate dehydrogenase E1 component alpha subunit